MANATDDEGTGAIRVDIDGQLPQFLSAADVLAGVVTPIPRPRAALGAATIWAIDDFTADNGATDIIAGSHLWGGRTPKEADRTPVVMAAGSCVFFLGTLWHGGGSNQSDSALTAQYCEPWLRPQEAFTLSMTRDTGYSAHARIQHPSALHRAGRRHAPQAAAGAGATSDLVLIHVVERDRTQLSFTDDVEQLVIDRRDGRVVEVSDDNCLWVEVLAGHVHDVLRGNYAGVR